MLLIALAIRILLYEMYTRKLYLTYDLLLKLPGNYVEKLFLDITKLGESQFQ